MNRPPAGYASFEALKRALLAAKTIADSDSASGVHLPWTFSYGLLSEEVTGVFVHVRSEQGQNRKIQGLRIVRARGFGIR
jgi:hypothetical protein